MTVRLRIHLGAHKTGTTSLQRLFHRHREMLARHGIAYIHEERTQISDMLRGRRDWDEEAVRRAFGGDGRARTVIFSDEDSLGHSSVRDGRTIYGPIGSAVARFVEAAPPGSEVRLLFCIRDLGAFLPSIYQQEVKQGRVSQSLKDYIDARVDMDRVSWVPVIRDLIGIPGCELSVWSFDYLRHDLAGVLSRFGLSPAVAQSLSGAFGKSNASISQTALEIMRTVNGLGLTRAEIRACEKFLTRSFPISGDHPKPPGLPSPQVDALQKRYLEDLRAIHNLGRTGVLDFAMSAQEAALVLSGEAAVEGSGDA